MALALAVKLKLLYFEFCDIDRTRHVNVMSTFITILLVKSFEDVLITCYFKEYSKLLNSAFRTIIRRSTRNKYFLPTDSNRSKTNYMNARELNKDVHIYEDLYLNRFHFNRFYNIRTFTLWSLMKFIAYHVFYIISLYARSKTFLHLNFFKLGERSLEICRPTLILFTYLLSLLLSLCEYYEKREKITRESEQEQWGYEC